MCRADIVWVRSMTGNVRVPASPLQPCRGRDAALVAENLLLRHRLVVLTHPTEEATSSSRPRRPATSCSRWWFGPFVATTPPSSSGPTQRVSSAGIARPGLVLLLVLAITRAD